MKTVCLVTEEIAGIYGSGGIGAAFLELAELLAKNNFAVDVLYCPIQEINEDDKKIYKQKFYAKGIKLDFVDYSDHYWGDHIYEKKAYAVYKHLKLSNYDCLHFHDYKGLAYFCASAKKQALAFSSTRIVVQMHGPTGWTVDVNKTLYTHEDQLKIDFMERKSVELSDSVVSPSQYLIDYLKDEQGFVFPADTRVIKNVSSSLQQQLKRFAQMSEDLTSVNEIVLFARHEDRKGFKEFCSAISSLNDFLTQKNITVTFLGKFGRIAGQHSGIFLANTSQKWTFPFKVITSYHREEAAKYLVSNSSSIVVTPSVENSPYTVLESLILNKVVITSGFGGGKELLVEDCHQRLLWNSDEPSDLAAVIENIVSYPINTPQMAQTPSEIDELWLKFHDEHVKSFEVSTHTPLVTVGITHYERPDKVIDAILSIVKQDYKNIEIIVVDDGSKSKATKSKLLDIENILTRIGGRLIYRENGYLGAARNTVIANANGEYLCFLDDDDIAKSNLVSTLVKSAVHTDADITNCLNQFMDISRRAEGVSNPDEFKEKISYVPVGGPLSVAYYSNCIGSATALIKKKYLTTSGAYTELKGVGHEDYELFLNALQNNASYYVLPEPLYLYEVGMPSMISSTSVTKNFRRIYDAIDIDVNLLEAKRSIGLQIGKVAAEHQVNMLQWSYSQSPYSTYLIPLHTGGMTPAQEYINLIEYSENLGNHCARAAFEYGKNVLDSNDKAPDSQLVNYVNHNFNDSGDSQGLLFDVKILVGLQRFDSALSCMVNSIVFSHSFTALHKEVVSYLSSLNTKYSDDTLFELIDVLFTIPIHLPIDMFIKDITAFLAGQGRAHLDKLANKILEIEVSEYLELNQDIQLASSSSDLTAIKHYYKISGRQENRRGFNKFNLFMSELKKNPQYSAIEEEDFYKDYL
ncbi:glycosyltransferase [bacterium Scap17]|nr:glycosyltransferase [bacterium Scap17]